MSKQLKVLIIALAIISMADMSYAEKTRGLGDSSNKTSGPKDLAAECAPPGTSIDLDLNNVRARIHTGGDMWGDLQSSAAYEVPKDGGVHAIFSGSL